MHKERDVFTAAKEELKSETSPPPPGKKNNNQLNKISEMQCKRAEYSVLFVPAPLLFRDIQRHTGFARDVVM